MDDGEPKYVRGAKATFTAIIEIDGIEDVGEAMERFAYAMRQGSDMKKAFYYNNIAWSAEPHSYHPDDVWDSHPKYLREEWIHEVMSKDTNLGYWDWVNHQIEIDTYDD